MTRILPILLALLVPSIAVRAAEAGDGYRLETGIPYRSGAGQSEAIRERCVVDVYHPVERPGFATVVWFHGGGLTGGRRSVPAALRGRGIAVVAAGYRLNPTVKAPGYIEDAAAAVAWTFRNIGRFGGDTNRIFVSGHSAGGYLTSMVGLDRRWLAAEGVDADRIAGLVPFSGHAITHFTVRAERGIPDTQPVVDDLAPLYHVRGDAPPILLISGDRELEMLGRYEESAYLWRMLRVAGHRDARILEVQGFDHGGMVGPGLELLVRFVAEHTR